jgi:hypothetical protein
VDPELTPLIRTYALDGPHPSVDLVSTADHSRGI